MEEKYITSTTVNGENYKFRDEGAARSEELSEEIANRESAVSSLEQEVGEKQGALSEAQLSAVNSGIDATKVAQIQQNAEGVATNATNIATAELNISDINGKIPAQASSSNQLADRNFVNSSIQTQTAHFRGNWENWAAVPSDASLYPVDDDGNHEPTSNDYMVLQDASDYPVESGEEQLAGTWRFKYSGTWTTNGKNGWHPEYQVNETPLTSDQLAALNSGITAQAVAKLLGIPADAEANTINSISVNGTPVTPDADKNVDLTIEGGIKTLTTEDYNWNRTTSSQENPDCIGLWLLDPGIYKIAGGVSTIISRSDQKRRSNEVRYLLSSRISDNQDRLILLQDASNPSFALFEVTSGGVSKAILLRQIGGTEIITAQQVINNLTSSYSYNPLSAAQGKVLNEKIVGTTETKTIDTTDWTALSDTSSYTYSTTVTASATISSSTGVVELINDQPVLFATFGFVIGEVSGQNITLYSIGQPSAPVSLKLNIRNL